MNMEKQCQTKTPPIYVTKTDAPDLSDVMLKLEEIWDSGIFTNNGAQVQTLESELCKKLSIPNCTSFANGTIALQAALAIHDLSGEVITTPFSFVASSQAILNLGLTPKFVDIDPLTLCIDPIKIKEAITDKTSAILAVHVYGIPCAIEEIEDIAHRHNLKVIYDAAHCFDIQYKGASILNYGDASILSFHATKSFNTIEGGAVIAQSENAHARAKQYRNFGFDSMMSAQHNGTNGKMNEIQAAIGMLNLQNYDSNKNLRKNISSNYSRNINKINGIITPYRDKIATNNYSYYPIIIEDDYPINTEELLHKFEQKNIFPRRYFYPLITEMEAFKDYKQNCPIALDKSKKILCLPIYSQMSEHDQKRVLDVLEENAL